MVGEGGPIRDDDDGDGGSGDAPRRRERPVPPVPDEARLYERALRYLARFAASEGRLADVLRRKALREGRLHGLSDGQVEEMIRNVVARVRGAGYVDDEAYALTRARGLAGRGRSLRRVRADLAFRGVDRETAEGAVARLREEQADPELAAALVLARRKRLGPWRPAARFEHRARDVEMLVRAGFDARLAREIVTAATPEELEERLAELLAEDDNASSG